MSLSATPFNQSVHLRLRATQEQHALLRRAAKLANKSLGDFVLGSACQAAEQMLLDQPTFMVSGAQCQALMQLLELPEKPNEGLGALYSRKVPWETQ